MTAIGEFQGEELVKDVDGGQGDGETANRVGAKKRDSLSIDDLFDLTIGFVGIALVGLCLIKEAG